MSGDIRYALDRFIDKMGKITGARVEMDEAQRLRRAALPRCGNCEHWMKSRDCPREQNVNGWNRGPSSEGLPCTKYQETRSALGSPQALRDKADQHEARAHALLNIVNS